MPVICWFLCLWTTASVLAQQSAIPANDPAQLGKPYVLLISFDGFRFDYAERYQATNLLAFAKAGVRADAMVPSFQSSTFPNHYTLVTGLYPAHHGIVANDFYDPARKAEYHMSRPETGLDGSWYGGTPLWVLAEQQGMRTASFFWPGSDTEIQKTRPSKYYRYDGKTPNETRIQQVVDWFKLPKTNRPHFVTLYFSDTDDSGHTFGPESEETKQAVHRVDALFGQLLDGLKQTDVAVDVFVVADHGMMEQRERIDLGTTTDFPGVEVMPASGSIVMLYSKDPARRDAAERFLKNKKDPRFRVYRKSQVPKHLHFRDSERIGDLVVLAQAPVNLFISQPGVTPSKMSKGAHGYDPKQFPAMRGTFLAQGPDLVQGKSIPQFQNIHVYPIIAHLLGLTPPKVDGSLDVLRPILRKGT